MSDLNARFRIDLSLTDSEYYPIGLFVRRRAWWGGEVWRELNRFTTRELAISHYEKIKDLPEYLP
jgi:hypothetical protein